MTDDDGSKYIAYSFIYVAALSSSLVAAAEATVQLPINADADFVWTKTTYSATLAGAAITSSTIPVPLITVSLQDTGSGRALQSAPVQISNMAGVDGGLPFILTVPLILDANSNVTVTFRNYSAATAYLDVKLNLIGYKKISAV